MAITNSRLFLIAGGLVIIVVILLAVIVLRGVTTGNLQDKMNLEFWGVFDDSKDFESAIIKFRSDFPNINIKYRKFSFDDYEQQLINALAAGKGPDIWMMHNTWLPKHMDKIQPVPLPSQLPKGEKPFISFSDFSREFVDVAKKDLTRDGIIYALPIYVDTLALYYNKDIFDSYGIALPPKTWDEFGKDVKVITKLTDNKIEQSAAAIGTARNINRSTDILALLMLQSGLKVATPQGADISKNLNGKNIGEVALQFYTDFSNPKKEVYTWNDNMDFSLDAFKERKTAMMFNYSHHIKTLRSQAPRFDFDVAPMPQADLSQKVNYANYWALTVSKSSANPIAAWRFVEFMSSKEGARLYLNSSKRPPARRDLIDLKRNDFDLGVFSVQALSADSWYQADNLAMQNILADMIDDVNFGRRSFKEAIEFAESQINTIIFRENSKKL